MSLVGSVSVDGRVVGREENRLNVCVREEGDRREKKGVGN